MATSIVCPGCGKTSDAAAPYCQNCGRPLAAAQPPAATPPFTSAPVPAAQPPAAALGYAGFWIRFVAFLIDACVLTVAFLPLRILFGIRFWGLGRPVYGAPFFGIIFFASIFRLIVNWLYFAGLESSPWQATLGKLALGLRVVDLEGRRISFGQATGRFFGKILSAMIFCIGFIMAGFTARKQALHDMLAGTYVLHGPAQVPRF